MSIDLTEARATLLNALEVDNTSFSNAQLDRAIIEAGEHFLSLVPGAATTTDDVTLSPGTSTVDLTDEIPGFVQNDFVDRATIDFYRVSLAPYEMVARRWQGGTPTAARPSLIGFRDDAHALFNVPTDQEYTLQVTHAASLTSFSPGTMDQVTLNLPTSWAQRIIRTGAAAAVLTGGNVISVGQIHPGAGTLTERFEKVIADAQRVFPSTANGVIDRNTPKGR